MNLNTIHDQMQQILGQTNVYSERNKTNSLNTMKPRSPKFNPFFNVA